MTRSMTCSLPCCRAGCRRPPLLLLGLLATAGCGDGDAGQRSAIGRADLGEAEDAGDPTDESDGSGVADGGIDAGDATEAAADADAAGADGGPQDDGSCPDAAADAEPDGGAAEVGPDGGESCLPPPLPFLTVNRIPETMNGSQPFTNLDFRLEPYHLLLPRASFTLDLIGTPGEVQRFGLLGLGCGGRDWLPLAAAVDDGWTATAPADDPLPPGSDPVICRALLRPPCPPPAGSPAAGEGAPPPQDPAPVELSLAVEIGELTPALDPFDRPETWLLLHRRDHWTLTTDLAPDGTIDLAAEPVPNGIADLDEALAVVGLGSDDTAAGAAEVEEDGARGASAIFRQRLLSSTRAQLNGLFGQSADGSFVSGAVPIHFVLEGEPGAPDPADFSPSGDFSMIGLGGGDPDSHNAGMAYIDWNNERMDDNATDPELGIFTTSMIALFLDMNAARVVLSPLAPLLGGTPVGGHPADAQIFAPGFDASLAPGDVAQRATLFDLATSLLGRGLAALIAHEIGHSLGLVALGPPPQGLFGGEVNGEFADGPFDGPHINTPGFNIMQQGYALAGAGLELLAAQPSFNELNMAYLRGRLIVDPSRPRGIPW